MTRFVLALALLCMSLPAVADDEKDITIISHGAHTCAINFDSQLDGMMMVQWAKVVASVATPESYLDLFKVLKSPSEDEINQVRTMISYCMGSDV